MSFTLDEWSKIATVAAAVFAVFAVLYAARQVKLSAKISRANFWLEIRKMFAEHQVVHLKLRNGEWPGTDENFPDEADWSKLEAYMGLFEHCEVMLNDNLLDWNTFHDIYGYRILLIANNPLIVREKIINRRKGWKKFVNLLARMNDEMPDSRYVSGYWTSTKCMGFLWWGFVHREEGYVEFTDWNYLEARYYELLNQIVKPDTSVCAWLRKDWDTIHQWPAKQYANELGKDHVNPDGRNGITIRIRRRK